MVVATSKVALAAMVLASCATPSQQPHAAAQRVEVRTEVAGGDVLAIPATILGEVRGRSSGDRLILLRLAEGPEAAGFPGAFVGICGSPVYDAKGHCFAIVLDRMGGDEKTICMATPCTAVLDACFGKDAVSLLETEPTTDNSQKALRPGESVAMLGVWGDVRVGTFGTVSMGMDHRVVCLFTQNPGYFEEEADCHYALARAPTVAVSPGNGIGRICTLGEIVGTVRQFGSRGAWGTVGDGPEEVTITVSMRCGDVERKALTFKIPFESARWNWWLVTGLRSALAEWGVRGPGYEGMIEVRGGEHFGERRSAVGSGGGDVSTEMLAMVSRAFDGLSRAPDHVVAVTISLRRKQP